MPNLLPTMASTTPPLIQTSTSAEPLRLNLSEPEPTTGAQKPPTPKLKPSTAIQHGAERIVELVEHEKSVVAGLYHKAMQGLEANHKKYQENSEVMLRSIERKVEKRDAKITELQTELHRTRQIAVDTSSELEKLQKEHETLKASLSEVGLVRVDGRLQFNDAVARVVDEFVQGAKIQQNAFSSSRLGTTLTNSSTEEEDMLSGPVGPSEFFTMLSAVMAKARRFAESLGKREREHLDSYSTSTPQKMESVWEVSYHK